MPDIKEIQDAINNGEFFLEYLPVMDLHSGRCLGGEALSRWRRPDGVVSPLEFLPYVENTLLSGLLTYFVVEQIAKELLDWLNAHDAFVSFNMPPEIIGRGGVAHVAEKCGLMALKSKVVVEITERGLPDKLAFDAINYGAEQGVRIALDDVGTSRENLIALFRCNAEIVKLDRRLISGLRAGAPLPREIEDLAPLLATRRFKVIAEGVETLHQVDVLRTIGVEMVQGFYYSKPLPAEEFMAFFAQRASPDPK